MLEATPEEPPKNSIIDTSKAIFELIQTNAHKLIKYQIFKKNNSPKPLAILKVEPPKKEVEFVEPEFEGESPEQEPEMKEEKEPPKLDIPNYDELE